MKIQLDKNTKYLLFGLLMIITSAIYIYLRIDNFANPLAIFQIFLIIGLFQLCLMYILKIFIEKSDTEFIKDTRLTQLFLVISLGLLLTSIFQSLFAIIILVTLLTSFLIIFEIQNKIKIFTLISFLIVLSLLTSEIRVLANLIMIIAVLDFLEFDILKLFSRSKRIQLSNLKDKEKSKLPKKSTNKASVKASRRR